jgi:hypothetical protein
MWQPILPPLSLSEALLFIPLAKRKRMTPWEQLSYSMIAGGIPQYLEIINYSKTIEENLVDLGACPRMEARLWKIRIWPFPALFPVK